MASEPVNPDPAAAVVSIQTSPQSEPIRLPAILFTDDRGKPCPPTAAGSTPRPEVALPALLLTGDPTTASSSEPAPLPEIEAKAAGAPAETTTLWLGAQDPHMVCAQWNVPAERIAETAAIPESALQLRIVAETPAPTCIVEQPVEPTATESFVAVPEARAPYHAELGVRTAEGEWQVLAVSASTTTPPDAPIVDFSYSESVWSAPAVEPWYPDANPAPAPSAEVSAPPPSVAPMAATWVHRTRPPSKTSTLRLLALSQDESWGEAFASHSLAGRRSAGGMESDEENEFGQEEDWEQGPPAPSGDHPSSGSLGSGVGADSGPEGLPSSLPAVPPTRGRKFWFKINAEVILYGSTEPDATVTIGSYPVKLRPDGSFSFRFALPDGEFPLPVVAVAADGHDGRAATVTFRRATQTMGMVGVHPQDPALQPPHPENAL